MVKSYRADYPRPQLVRNNWMNLNGTWNFAFDDAKLLDYKNGVPAQQTIIVPFTYETKTSGINEQAVHERVWYSRTITLLPSKNKKLLLHFEGSDYETTVFVNGVTVGKHIGGYARFSFDITNAAVAGDNVIAVMINDSLNPEQPRGKQRWLRENFGCWYVQTTGIWKTVWMEEVPDFYIQHTKLTPLWQQRTLAAEVEIETGRYDGSILLEIVVRFEGRFINSVTVPVLQSRVCTTLNIHRTEECEQGIHSWTPAHPDLYDLELRLLRDTEVVDEVQSYFGLREIRIEGKNILLNGAPLYQRLVLDQGYWEDSHLTPPDEQALLTDIEKIKELGFNGLRKHQKTEDERFLFWCDVKGMLVWGEMASAYEFSDKAVDAFLSQWGEVVRQNYSHPCIITWTPLNESWGVSQIKHEYRQQSFSQAVYYQTKCYDPYRPVIVNDGWEHTISDIITLHDYEEKGTMFAQRYQQYHAEILEGSVYHCGFKSAFAEGFTYQGQPVLISEYGGIAFSHDTDGWGYGNKVATQEDFVGRYEAVTKAIQALDYCGGFCYTQATDVQQEVNGLMDTKRNFKVNVQKIQAINTKDSSCLLRQNR